MTTAHVAFIILIALCAVCFAGWIGGRIERKRLLNQLNISDMESRAHHALAVKASQNFLDACRIIDIRINGRSLFITCARNDETFIIETMALMSTDVREMRHNAGLD